MFTTASPAVSYCIICLNPRAGVRTTQTRAGGTRSAYSETRAETHHGRGHRILPGGSRDTFNLSMLKPQKTTSAEQLVMPYYHAKLLVQQPVLSNNKQQDYKGVSITTQGAKPHAHTVQ